MSYRPICDVILAARCKHGYYGGFPAGALERLRAPLGALIDDPVLFVCGGMVKKYPYRGFGPNDVTVDINKKLKPDYVLDVRRELPSFASDHPFGPRAVLVSPPSPKVGKKALCDGWRAMIVDTPYSPEEAEHYGTREQYPQPGPLLRLCLEHTRPGGRVGFLHWEWPAPPKEVHGCKIKETFVALVTTGRRSRARHYVVFEKVKK